MVRKYIRKNFNNRDENHDYYYLFKIKKINNINKVDKYITEYKLKKEKKEYNKITNKIFYKIKYNIYDITPSTIKTKLQKLDLYTTDEDIYISYLTKKYIIVGGNILLNINDSIKQINKKLKDKITTYHLCYDFNKTNEYNNFMSFVRIKNSSINDILSFDIKLKKIKKINIINIIPNEQNYNNFNYNNISTTILINDNNFSMQLTKDKFKSYIDNNVIPLYNKVLEKERKLYFKYNKKYIKNKKNIKYNKKLYIEIEKSKYKYYPLIKYENKHINSYKLNNNSLNLNKPSISNKNINKLKRISVSYNKRNIKNNIKSPNLIISKGVKYMKKKYRSSNANESFIFISYLLKKYNDKVDIYLSNKNKNILQNREISKKDEEISFKIYSINIEFKKDFYNILFDGNQIDLFLNMINSNNKNRFYFIFTDIYDIDDFGSDHANLLIYDKKYKKIYHFEPHGKAIFYNTKKVDEKLTNFFNQYISIGDVINLDKYIREGPQSLEEKYDKVDKNDPGGFCSYWSFYFVEFLLTNSIKEEYKNYKVEEYLKLLINKINKKYNRKYSKFIRSYYSSVNNIIINYVDNEEDYNIG